MSTVGKFFCTAAYGISVIFLPWWVSAALAVVLLAVWQAYFSVILGALAMDIIFGGPILSFAGFSYLYTLLFGILAVVTVILNRTLLE